MAHSPFSAPMNPSAAPLPMGAPTFAAPQSNFPAMLGATPANMHSVLRVNAPPAPADFTAGIMLLYSGNSNNTELFPLISITSLSRYYL